MKSSWNLFLCLTLVLGVAGCGRSGDSSSSYGGDQKNEYSIAVIPKGTTHEFWKSIHAGSVKAERELNEAGTPTEIIWKGPLKENDRDQQIQIVENFMTRRVDGIVLAPLDSQALVSPVENAAKAGIPVVIIDSGLDTDKYVSFVATDNYKGGRMAGEHLAKLLNGKGKVIVLRYQVGSASTTKRENGFLDAIKEHPEIEILSEDQYCGGPTREMAYQSAQNLFNRYGQQVDGVFAPCEPVTIGVTMALQELNKAKGQVKVVGFDVTDKALGFLKDGDVQALVVQDPVRMGDLGVKTVIDHLQGNQVSNRVDTGVSLVTPDNLDQPEIQRLVNPPLDKYLN